MQWLSLRHQRTSTRLATMAPRVQSAFVEQLEPRLVLSSTTALDAYVAAPDASFSFSHHSTFSGLFGTINYVLDMTSQTWRTPAEVNRTQWQHWVTVTIPVGAPIESTTAILFIDGGSNSSNPPTSVDLEMELLAAFSESVVVRLPTVPNQPLRFSDETQTRSEDALLAYSFDKFMATGDDTWPALLPMVKSAVRAMDAVQDFVPNITGGEVTINDFVVGGGSKRGWTTWLTAAVDERVSAIVPVVFDVLNMEEQIPHHLAHYEGVTSNIIGGYSTALKDYVDLNIFDRIDTPEGQALMAIVDPYAYRDRLDMPKYMLNATGDEFFVPDSAQFYFDDLLGERHLAYMPNSGHGVTDDPIGAIAGVVPFYHAVAFGGSLPEYSWTLEDGGRTLRVETADAPSSVFMWKASNPNSRDFRWFNGSGPTWTPTVLTDQGGGVYVATVNPPETGATAFMVELTFGAPGLFDYRFTTQISVVGPATAPLADAGGPYTASEGTAITLSAAGSTGVIDLYEWDLNNDGNFETLGPSVEFLPDDNGVFVVGLRVTGPGGSSTDTAIITVENVAPTAGIGGPGSGVRGQPRTFTLTANDPSPVDQAAGFAFDIDWNGDGVVDETVFGPSGTLVEHVFPTTGSFNVRVTARDKDGGTSDVTTHPIEVHRFLVVPDEVNPVVSNLVVGGSTGIDYYLFLPGGGTNILFFRSFENSVMIGASEMIPGVTGRIITYAQGTFSNVIVGELLTSTPVEFHGSNGNDVLVGSRAGDTLIGGGGNDILIGGTAGTDGGDLLIGSSGRNILMSHRGANTIMGGSGDDLIMAGTHNFPFLPVDIFSIQPVWLSAQPYETRVANLLPIIQPGTRLLNNNAVDEIHGGGGRNWFLLSEAEDIIHDLDIDETVTDIG